MPRWNGRYGLNHDGWLGGAPCLPGCRCSWFSTTRGTQRREGLAGAALAAGGVLGVVVVGGLGYVKFREHRAAEAAKRSAAQSD